MTLRRGTEAPSCLLDIQSSELCCLPGAKIQGVTERLPQLVQSTDRYRLLLFHVGTNDMVKESLSKIKKDFRALEAQMKGTDAPMIFSSVFPVRDRGVDWSQCILQIYTWPRGWCHCQGFVFYNHRTFFNEYSLLERNGIHLPRRGRRIFTSRLADVVNCVLN